MTKARAWRNSGESSPSERRVMPRAPWLTYRCDLRCAKCVSAASPSFRGNRRAAASTPNGPVAPLDVESRQDPKVPAG